MNQLTFGAPSDLTINRSESAQDVAIGPDGSVYIAGSATEGVNNFALLAKFNPNQFNTDLTQAVIWQITYQGAPFASGLALSPEGNSIYIVGQTASTFERQGDAYLAKFDTNGTLIWQRTWGDVFNDGWHDVAVAGDGSVYATGFSQTPNGNNAVLVKFSPDGTLVWQREWAGAIGGSNDESEANGVTVSADGSVYMVGRALITGSGQFAALVKFDPDGNVIWQRLWGGQLDAGHAGAVGPDSNISITGNTLFGSGSGDAFIATFMPNGRSVGAVTWGGTDNDGGESIAIAADGSIHVSGSTFSSPPYTFARARKSAKTPRNPFLSVPPGMVSTPTAGTGNPGLTLAPISGSQSFAGGTDAFVIKVIP
jgi:uncharacterized delta-60 repeat protein